MNYSERLRQQIARHPRSGPYASNDGQAKLIFYAGEFVRALKSHAYRYLALESSEGLTA